MIWLSAIPIVQIRERLVVLDPLRTSLMPRRCGRSGFPNQLIADSTLFFAESTLVRGLMSDAEWAFFEPFVVEKGPRRGRRPRDHRLVLDGVFWIARTGTAWRDLHSHFGPWNSVYRQFRRWTQAGIWDVMLEALNETGAGNDSVQMIDSTIIRAHQHAAGALKKGMRTKVLAALVVVSRPRSTSAATLSASLSRSR